LDYGLDYYDMNVQLSGKARIRKSFELIVKTTASELLSQTMQNVGACLQAIPRVESPASRLLHRSPDGVMFTSDGGVF
jgi:hypothetical protein